MSTDDTKKKAAPKKAAAKKTPPKKNGDSNGFIDNINWLIVIKAVLFILLMVFGPFFTIIGDLITNANTLALYYLIWFILLFPYFSIAFNLLMKYYNKMLNRDVAKDITFKIKTAKDAAAVLLITMTIALLFAAFDVIKVTNFPDVEGQLIAVLGMIGGAYAAARNDDKRSTLGGKPFTVRAVVSFLALIGILFGSVVAVRILFVEIIAIALGRSIDKN